MLVVPSELLSNNNVLSAYFTPFYLRNESNAAFGIASDTTLSLILSFKEYPTKTISTFYVLQNTDNSVVLFGWCC